MTKISQTYHRTKEAKHRDVHTFVSTKIKHKNKKLIYHTIYHIIFTLGQDIENEDKKRY